MKLRTCHDLARRRAIRRDRARGSSAGAITRRSTALAAVAVLIGAAGASAAVRLTTGSAYSGKSSVCPQPKIPGTTCVFRFKASRNGFGLRFVGHTVVSSWTCRRGGGGVALLGGKVIGSDPVPGLVLQPDGKLYGRTGHGPSKVAVTGHIAETGTKVVLRFHLVHQHCVTPKVTLIEGVVPGGH